MLDIEGDASGVPGRNLPRGMIPFKKLSALARVLCASRFQTYMHTYTYLHSNVIKVIWDRLASLFYALASETQGGVAVLGRKNNFQ